MSNRISLEGITKVLAIASGKGGVGKSTVSVNVALSLAKLGYRVGIFDGDVHGPDIPLMLGVRRLQRAEGEVAEVALAVSPEVEKDLPKGKPLERYGLKMMSLGLLVAEEQPIIPDTLLIGRLVMQILRSTDWGELDYLLIDLPPGTGEPQITLAYRLQIDGVVLVTTPADVALLDTTKALNLYREQQIPILGLVENMSFYICPNCGEREEVFPRSQREAERSLKKDDIALLGQIPLTPLLGEAADSGRPLLITDPASPVAQAFLTTAERLAEILAHQPARLPEPPAPEEAPEKPLTTPARLPIFHSKYLEEFMLSVLTLVKEKIGDNLESLQRDEAGMREIALAYRQAMQEIGTQMNANLQKELLGWIMSNTLAKNS